MIRFFSLIKSLYVRSGRLLLKYVSPPLVGVVFCLLLSVEIQAAPAVGTVLKSSTVDFGIYANAFTVEDSAGIIQPTITSGYAAVDTTKDASLNGVNLKYVFKNIKMVLPYDIVVQNHGGNNYYDDLIISNVKLHLLVNGVEYILYPNYIPNHNGMTGEWPNRIRTLYFAGEEYIEIYTKVMDRTNASLVYAYVTFDQIQLLGQYITDAVTSQHTVRINGTCTAVYDVVVSDDNYDIGDVELENPTDIILYDIDKGNEARWEEDRSDAESAGSEMSGFASQLDNLKNTWSILWYPIEFTNRFVQVFVGGTSSVAYLNEFAYTTGYTYNDDTGFLEPIMARSVQPASAGTGITFPAFSLMGYQIWDSYTYDLSEVKDQLPVVFDALYVIVSILEMLWFVGYLRKKYEEVFG